MDHYIQISNRLTELKSYPNHTKAQLEEIVSIQDEIIAGIGPKVVAIPFTIEDCEELRDGGSFEWVRLSHVGYLQLRYGSSGRWIIIY